MKTILAFLARLFGRSSATNHVPPAPHPAERFYQEWAAGALPLPYVCCTAMQLYAAFQRWSHLNGEYFPPTQTEFSVTVMRAAAGHMHRAVLWLGPETNTKKRTIYLVGLRPDNMPRWEWAEAGMKLFDDAVNAYQNPWPIDLFAEKQLLPPNPSKFCRDCAHSLKTESQYLQCTAEPAADIVTGGPQACESMRRHTVCGPDAKLFAVRVEVAA